ncbi:MAG: YggS family pyridoxal phosphate-dependent enzyme [Salinarimonadaceae bacterium]|nr:MAG: YggS family pyridoxal phosphate-dependent enzyme [Salinarimonadaceae bacterium]
MTDGAEIASRFEQTRERIARAAHDCGRNPGSIALVAVSKTFGADAILPVLEAGHRVFGENYVQETAAKWPALRERFSDVELHLIGPLQSNKARDAVALFDVIETLDRLSLAKALSKEIARAKNEGRRVPKLLVQVNTGEEAQKGGVAPADADAFIAACRDEWGLAIEGLMSIPPLDEPPSPHFAFLAEIAKRNHLPLLSMGMTADFEAAIQLGATHVRIGSAIFGTRRSD